MEIVGIIVLIAVVALIIGSIDNAKPVTSWPDEKLQRMYGKLLHASTVAVRAGDREQAKAHLDKAKEVQKEIEARRSNVIRQSAERLAEEKGAEIRSVGQKSAEAIQKIMSEQGVDYQTAGSILVKRMEEAHAKYVKQGMTDDQADEAAMKEVIG